MRLSWTSGLLRTLAASCALAVGLGCSFQLTPDTGRGTPNIPATSIIVKAVNQTGQPLDPQLYVGPIAGGVNGLFVTAHKRTDFGVGGIGVLLPKKEASFSVACDEAVLIGTRGGVFGEDLTTPQGHGQSIVLEEGLSVRCGDLVTFTFRAEGDQLYTSYAVRAQND